MKTSLKLLIAVLLTGWCNITIAQYEWQEPPKPTENVLGIITGDCPAPGIRQICDEVVNKSSNDQQPMTEEELYLILLSDAQKKYDDENVQLRNFKISGTYEKRDYIEAINCTFYILHYKISASVIGSTKKRMSNAQPNGDDDLFKALDKALQDIREGSRIAIDQVRVPSGTNREEYKDEVVEILLDKGYKVVAKEYLEKLYEEQQAQQSGIYNDRTTVKENNFSAVGYYLNVRLTETSLRVQVINVSTGEYDANVTIKL